MGQRSGIKGVGGGVGVVGEQAGSDWGHRVDFVYLERSYSILRRKANKLSAPLEQEAAAAAAARERQAGVRSIVTNPE